MGLNHSPSGTSRQDARAASVALKLPPVASVGSERTARRKPGVLTPGIRPPPRQRPVSGAPEPPYHVAYHPRSSLWSRLTPAPVSQNTRAAQKARPPNGHEIPPPAPRLEHLRFNLARRVNLRDRQSPDWH